MNSGRRTLARLFVGICLSVAIIPAFYTYTTQAELNEQSTKQSLGAVSGQTMAKRKVETCTKVRASISNRTSNLEQTANRHTAVIDQIYDNATDYAALHGFVIKDSELIAVVSNRAAVQTALRSLASSEDTLNCEDTNVGAEAAELRLQVLGVHTALESYRNAVSDVLKAMKAQAVSGVIQ